MAQFIVALDQGTTGSTALVVSSEGRILGKATCEFKQHFPQAGWVEHDPEEIWASILEATAGALKQSGLNAQNCAAIGITNQRETTLLWDKATGKPLARAIVWQDRRTSARCAELKAQGLEARVRERTGLVLDPYFSGTKIEWLLDHIPSARERAERGELAFGTIDSFLVHRLSGQAAHITDVTNASRTLLFNIHTMAWDPELLTQFRVPKSLLPEVRSSSEVVAKTRGVPGLPDGIPIAGIAGDQQAALFGQTCFTAGQAKCTYGTGAFLLMNTGKTPVTSKHGLLTTVAWKLGSEVFYALEGSVFIAGAAVQWLRDGLKCIQRASEVEALAKQVPSSGDVVFVPALAGLGAPHWDPDARGLIAGLTRDTTVAHIARASLEGIAFQIMDLVQAMQADASTNATLRSFRVDGGAAQNNFLMQLQSDLVRVPVERPHNVESTALGAAFLAGLAVGFFSGLEAIARLSSVEAVFEPTMSEGERNTLVHKWQRAIQRTLSHGRPS